MANNFASAVFWQRHQRGATYSQELRKRLSKAKMLLSTALNHKMKLAHENMFNLGLHKDYTWSKAGRERDQSCLDWTRSKHCPSLKSRQKSTCLIPLQYIANHIQQFLICEIAQIWFICISCLLYFYLHEFSFLIHLKPLPKQAIFDKTWLKKECSYSQI